MKALQVTSAPFPRSASAQQTSALPFQASTVPASTVAQTGIDLGELMNMMITMMIVMMMMKMMTGMMSNVG